MSEHVDSNTGGVSGPDPLGYPGEQGPAPLGLAGRLDDLVLRFEVWRERPGLIWSLLVVGALVAALGWWLGRPSEPVPIEDLIPRAEPDSGGGTAAVADDEPASDQPAPPPVVQPERLVAHVVGEVARPGLVNLAPGSRIDDAVAAAGGLTAAADVERLNLAAPVGDGTQIRVPAMGEEVTGPLIVEAGPGSGTEAAGSSGPTGPVNLNTATATELESLPGVGPATAAAIISWRSENGGFLTVEDLTQVPGIGPVKLAALGDLVSV